MFAFCADCRGLDTFAKVDCCSTMVFRGLIRFEGANVFKGAGGGVNRFAPESVMLILDFGGRVVGMSCHFCHAIGWPLALSWIRSRAKSLRPGDLPLLGSSVVTET